MILFNLSNNPLRYKLVFIEQLPLIASVLDSVYTFDLESQQPFDVGLIISIYVWWY